MSSISWVLLVYPVRQPLTRMSPLAHLTFKYKSAILFSVCPIVLYSLLPLSSSKMECFFYGFTL